MRIKMRTKEQVQEMYSNLNNAALKAVRGSGNSFEVISAMCLVLMWVLEIVDELDIEN